MSDFLYQVSRINEAKANHSRNKQGHIEGIVGCRLTMIGGDNNPVLMATFYVKDREGANYLVILPATPLMPKAPLVLLGMDLYFDADEQREAVRKLYVYYDMGVVELWAINPYNTADTVSLGGKAAPTFDTVNRDLDLRVDNAICVMSGDDRGLIKKGLQGGMGFGA